MPMRPELRRRGVLLAASLICTALCAGCGEVHPQVTDAFPRLLTVAIADRPSALYASLYAAQADGDFRLGALAVAITHPPDALRALESRAAAVAIASEPALLAARAGGAQLVAIGALESGPLEGVVSLASHPILRPAALAGTTIALDGTALAAAELRTMLATAHLTPASVHVAGTGSVNPPLSYEHAQAVLADQWPLFIAALALAHHPAKLLRVQHAGVPTHSGLVIVVRVGEAHNDGPLLRAFLQSLTRGQRAAAASPAAIAATLAKINPTLNPAFERALLARTLPLAASALAGKPFGYQDPIAWVAFGIWMRSHGLLAGAQNYELAITDEFLPGQGEQTQTP
jgi:ABC-type nitrate/sulfonate/bicarbonate transport system substrate-binding protein